MLDFYCIGCGKKLGHWTALALLLKKAKTMTCPSCGKEQDFEWYIKYLKES